MNAQTEPSSRFLLIFVGAAAIFGALASVLVSWHSLALINKVAAIIFLVFLAVSPFRQVSYHRRGRSPMGPYDGLIVGYLITILALTSLIMR